MTISELDVEDNEVQQWRMFVRCEECDDCDQAMDMVRDTDGAWLCHPCDNAHKREWREQQRYLGRM